MHSLYQTLQFRRVVPALLVAGSAGVRAEDHIAVYERGILPILEDHCGHAFGCRGKYKSPADGWVDRLHEWMVDRKFTNAMH